MDLKSPILKVLGNESRAQRDWYFELDDNSLLLRCNTRRNNGSSTRNGSRSEHDIRILSGEY